MPHDLEAILTQANAAVLRGDIDGYLAHCTDDTRWTFVGEQTLVGKAPCGRTWSRRITVRPSSRRPT